MQIVKYLKLQSDAETKYGKCLVLQKVGFVHRFYSYDDSKRFMKDNQGNKSVGTINEVCSILNMKYGLKNTDYSPSVDNPYMSGILNFNNLHINILRRYGYTVILVDANGVTTEIFPSNDVCGAEHVN
jgi:hypothetical protein